ncbi:hypothetical protein JXD38_02830, partial [candidate division WOR-3 bacterium]|nr:hypothetical protein [candidate division WOR-3 bacterium]
MRNCIMLAVVGILAAGCGGTRTSRPGAQDTEVWLSSTIGGQKVGYSVYRFDRLPEGYRFESFIKMTLAMAGSEQQVQSHSEAFTGPDLALRNFSFTFSSQDRAFAVKGRVAGNELWITAPGSKEERSIKLDGPVYPSSALGRMVVARHFAEDSTYRVAVFDAAVMGVSLAQVKVFGRESLTVGGKHYDAIKYTTRMAKTQVTSWIDDDGNAIVETSPPGIR